MPDSLRLPSVFRRRSLWFGALLIWAVSLWILSNGPIPTAGGPEIIGADKVLHFGYFFGGGGLLAAALYLRLGPKPNWRRLILVVVVALSAFGLLDEWHQSWIPERSGNDFGDWLADTLGALAGSLVFKRFHRALS